MLTKEDKIWISDNFAAKDALVAVATDITELKVDSKIMQDTLIRLEKKVDQSFDAFQKTLGIVEGLAGKVAVLDQENKFGSVILHRHDIQIHELATATGTTISE